MNWDRYAKSIEELVDLRERANSRRSADSRRQDDVTKELDSLRAAVITQRRKIIGLADRLGEPRPPLQPERRQGTEDFEAAVKSARNALNRADREVAGAEQRAKQPVLFPGLSQDARSASTYLIMAVLSSLLAYLVRALIHLAGAEPWPSYTAMWLFLGTPAVAVLAGFATLRTLGRPQIEEHASYWSWLLAGCFIAFFACWIVQVILDQL
jgi:hypothetical protein